MKIPLFLLISTLILSCSKNNEYIINDKFDDNSNNWSIDSENLEVLDDTTSAYNSIINNGILTLKTNVSDYAGSVYNDLEIDTTRDIEIGFKLKNETKNNYYLTGLIFFENIWSDDKKEFDGENNEIQYKYSDKPANFIGFSRDGSIAFRVFSNGNWNTIFYTNDSIVKKNDFNEVQLLCKCDSTFIFINSKKIKSIDKINKFGKRFNLSGCPSGKVLFDDFYIKYLGKKI